MSWMFHYFLFLFLVFLMWGVTCIGKCSLFNGEWIPNPSGPAYTNASCRFIDDHQNCMMNGRPDKEYLHWKWKPYGCDLPPFDAVRFLDSVRNKGWGLIGDSILRNQVQSLLCLLSKVNATDFTFSFSRDALYSVPILYLNMMGSFTKLYWKFHPFSSFQIFTFK
jgi:hypothetical protein